MGTRSADQVTPLYPQKLALTSPTGGGRSVGIVRSRTKATEFYIYIYDISSLRVNRRFIYKVCKVTNQIAKSIEQGISNFSSGNQDILRVIMKP